MQTIKTEIIINAPIAQVWENFIDFKNYADWNPFMRIQGEAKVGAQLENTIFLADKAPQTFKPTVLAVEKEVEFRWKGKLFVNGLFDGEHYFKFEKISEEKTRLIHGENFSGILVGLIMKMIKEDTQKGFETMNESLKQKSERTDLKKNEKQISLRA